jgi:hypothetical protein
MMAAFSSRHDLAFHHRRDRLNSRPSRRFQNGWQAMGIRTGGSDGRDAPVHHTARSGLFNRCIGPPTCVQARLVVLHRKHIIGLGIEDRRSDRGIAGNCVDSDDGPAECPGGSEALEQRRDRLLLPA